MNLSKAQRRKAKIKMALQGCSGSGKTYSSLLLAYGLTGDWKRIAIIDSENNSANLYSHLGDYNVLALETPFTPERYITAIEVCVKAGMEVIIIDSITHEWEELLKIHSDMPGNSFTNWSKITPMHNQFVQAILQAPVHIIATMRTKQDYVLSEKNGKMVPEKVGLKGIQRGEIDYEFTLVFDININHQVKVSKDRTGLFKNALPEKITPKMGAKIRQWCEADLSIDQVKEQIKLCNSSEELIRLYNEHPELQDELKDSFTIMKNYLITNQQKVNENGITSS